MILVPDNETPAIIADWIELYVCVEQKSISKSKIISKIQAQHGSVEESIVDGALNELQRRIQLYGVNALYSINGTVVSYNGSGSWRQHPEYIMCLIYSALGVINTTDGGTKLFEELSAIALQKYLNGEAIVLGHPAKASFKKQLEDLANRCFEQIGLPPRMHAKDAGVDVVGWKPIADRRGSQLFVLMQCAAGKNGPKTKKPIRLDHWSRYILLGNRTIPGMSLPKTVGQNDWTKMTEDFDLVLDRPRLVSLIESSAIHNTSLRRRIVRWCKNQLS